jgi:hypothetical protein
MFFGAHERGYLPVLLSAKSVFSFDIFSGCFGCEEVGMDECRGSGMC